VALEPVGALLAPQAASRPSTRLIAMSSVICLTRIETSSYGCGICFEHPDIVLGK
jgi:hypothetical protein